MPLESAIDHVLAHSLFWLNEWYEKTRKERSPIESGKGSSGKWGQQSTYESRPGPYGKGNEHGKQIKGKYGKGKGDYRSSTSAELPSMQDVRGKFESGEPLEWQGNKRTWADFQVERCQGWCGGTHQCPVKMPSGKACGKSHRGCKHSG